VVIILLGLIILRENPRQRINRITGIMMLLAGTGPLFAAFGFLMQLSTAVPISPLPLRRLSLIWEFFFPQMLLFALVFPRELFPLRKKSGITLILFLPHTIHFILITLFSSPEQVRTLIPIETLAAQAGLWLQPLILLLRFFINGMELLIRFHNNFFAFINLLYIVAAITLMMLGYRRIEQPQVRKQVGLVLWGIRASVGLYAIAFIFPHLHLISPSPTAVIILTVSALLIGAGSIGWAIIRYQFLNIRFMIRRGLIVSLTFGILIGLYLLIYSQGRRLIHGLFGIDLPVMEVLFIILSLLGFQPLLSAVERFLEKIFVKDQGDYRHMLRHLTREIMTTLDLDALRTKLTGTMERALSLERVVLLLPGPGDLFRVQLDSKQWALRFQPGTVDILIRNNGPIRFDDLALRATADTDLDRLQALNPHWILPLCYRDRLNGILLLGEKITHTVLSGEDLTVLSVMANQAAIAIENAALYKETLEKQRMQEELHFAKEIQRHLLPPRCIEDTHLELCGYNLPSKEVGGDYYDFITLSDEKIGIAIGDISGKGVPAAILMSNLQAALRLCATADTPTDQVMRRINAHIAETTSADRFATFFYSIFDRSVSQWTFTNAGHNYPLLIRQGEAPRWLKTSNIIIGVRPDFPYTTFQQDLQAGDLVVLYTDGVSEAVDGTGEQFGDARLMDTVQQVSDRPAQAVMDHILETATEFTHGHLQADDLTLVIFKVKPIS